MQTFIMKQRVVGCGIYSRQAFIQGVTVYPRYDVCAICYQGGILGLNKNYNTTTLLSSGDTWLTSFDSSSGAVCVHIQGTGERTEDEREFATMPKPNSCSVWRLLATEKRQPQVTYILAKHTNIHTTMMLTTMTDYLADVHLDRLDRKYQIYTKC